MNCFQPNPQSIINEWRRIWSYKRGFDGNIWKVGVIIIDSNIAATGCRIDRFNQTTYRPSSRPPILCAYA